MHDLFWIFGKLFVNYAAAFEGFQNMRYCVIVSQRTVVNFPYWWVLRIENRQGLLKDCTKDWSIAPPGTVKNAFAAIQQKKNPGQRIETAFNAIVKMVTHYVRDCYGGGPWKKQADEIVNEIKNFNLHSK